MTDTEKKIQEKEGSTMDKNTIFEAIKKNLVYCVPELENQDISMTDSLAALGANSVDRADIIMMTLEDFDIMIPLVSFSNAKNIEGIADIILRAGNA